MQETNYKFVNNNYDMASHAPPAPKQRSKTSYCTVAAAGFCCAVVLMVLIFMVMPSHMKKNQFNFGAVGVGGGAGNGRTHFRCEYEYPSWRETWADEKRD